MMTAEGTMSLIWGSHTLVMTRVDKLADRSVDNMMVEITDKEQAYWDIFISQKLNLSAQTHPNKPAV